MIKTTLKQSLIWLFTVVLLAVLILSFAPSVALSALGGNTITIGPDMIVDSISAGASKHYDINITNGFAVSVLADGLGETPAGASLALTATNDTSSFSARSWVSVDKTNFDPGINQHLLVTVNVPAGTGAGERYACVLLHGQPSEGTSVITDVLIPVILTVNSSSFVPNIAGQITSINVSSDSTGLVYTGKPISILTLLTDTGNCRITNATIEVTVKSSDGSVVFQNTSSLAAPSVLPNYPRLIDTEYNLGLSLGNNYTANANITLSNGNVIIGTPKSFNVVAPPPIPAAPVVTGPGSSTVPGTIINTLTPTFSWSAVPSARSYELTISRAPYTNNDAIFTSDPLTTTSFTLPDGSLFQGEKYHWQVIATNISGTGPASGLYFYTYGNQPSVGTNAATSVTATGATLKGVLLSLGGASSANVNFEYGTTTAYGSTTPTQNLSAVGPFTSAITGLTPNTTYHFRSKAVALNTTYGTDLTFTTLGMVPTISGFSPSSATTGDSVIINGTNFSAVNSVSFGGVAAASYNVVNATEIIAVVGNGSSGSVTVTTATGTANLNGFTFIPATTSTSASTTVTTTTTTTQRTSSTTTQTTTPMSSTTIPSRNYKGYFPPTIDEPSLTYQDFSADTDAKFNAADKTCAEASLTGTNNRGTIILVRYLNLPQTAVQFSSGSIKGGIGKTAIKFVGARVEGTTRGTATITVHYNDSEVSKYNTDSLVLGYFSQGTWHQCTNINISTQNKTVSGEIPISRLSGVAIGLGGNLIQQGGAVPFTTQNSTNTNTPGISWALVGIITITILVVGGVIFAIERNRRKTEVD